ncbi:hypothetical protein [Tenacibaculum jejuense]|uniref:Uncharacterized protein n=1 Tax=Tenacibaculum jejuense TaxID=584609 RepID=A0A238UCZ7_9FLAO|nr:hypothetical protein [Tenacibaculum jejuense]SNR16925.1 conserved protein of unknown function [Tenacibaculum jejuense]
MPTDNIIIDGDTVQFNPLQGMAIVAVKPGEIKASGKTKIKGKKVCIQGDELKVVVAQCTYTTPSFPEAGIGNLKIDSLNSNQNTSKSSSGNKPLLLAGMVFRSKFEVMSPAKLTVPGSAPVLDTTPFYNGTGRFIASNTTIKAI